MPPLDLQLYYCFGHMHNNLYIQLRWWDFEKIEIDCPLVLEAWNLYASGKKSYLGNQHKLTANTPLISSPEPYELNFDS